MKKRIIPITIGVSAIIALALALASQSTPSMQVASINTDRIVLETGGDCSYTVWLNHAPTCDDCRYYNGGSRVISGTNFTRLTVYWNATDLAQPTSGACFCGHWHCYSEAEWHGGDLWGTVAWRAWLPLVMKGASR